MDQITILHPDTLVVLGFLVERDVFELFLEGEGITHLIKEERNHNIAPPVVGLETGGFHEEH